MVKNEWQPINATLALSSPKARCESQVIAEIIESLVVSL